MNIKEKLSEYLLEKLLLLAAFLGLILWRAIPSEAWARIDGAIPKTALWAALALSLIVVVLLSAWVIRLRKASKTPQGNYFSDFRVIKDSENLIEIEVWYFYDGFLGQEKISILIEFLDQHGNRLSYDGFADGEQITVIGHKALANIYFSTTVKTAQKSVYIQLCMNHMYKGIFHCQKFPYRKTWVPALPK